MGSEKELPFLKSSSSFLNRNNIYPFHSEHTILHSDMRCTPGLKLAPPIPPESVFN